MAGLQNAGNQAQKFSQQAAGFFGSASKAAFGLAVTGIGAVGAGLAAAGQKAFNFSSDVQAATGDIQTQLGLSADEAQRYGEVIKSVWGDNFTGSIEEAGAAVVAVTQNLDQYGQLSNNVLTSITEQAVGIQDAWDVGIGESTNAAKALMDAFGISAEDAMTFVQVGLQEGLNVSGDFLDTIGEYSVQFADAGADAGQFFGLMESGLQSGMLGTDKAADLFKEFRVRILDGSTATADGLAQLGINAEDFLGKLASGQMSVADAFQEVKTKLGGVEDQGVLMQAGVALLGTQFEDLGQTAVTGIEFIDTALEDVTDRAGDLNAQYNDWPTMWEGIKRKAISALGPIGDKLLGMANEWLPEITEVFEGDIIPAIENAVEIIGVFMDGGLNEGLTAIFGSETADQIMVWVGAFQGFIAQVGAFVSEHSEAFKGALIALGAVLAGAAIAGGILAIVGAITALFNPITLIVGGIALLGAAWSQNWGGIQEKTRAVIDFLSPYVTGAVQFIKDFWAANGDQILAKASEVWTAVQTAVQSAITFIRDGIITPALEWITAFWQEHGELLLTAAQGIWETITQALSDAWNLITEIFNTFKALFTGNWEEFGRGIFRVWMAAWTLVVNWLTGLWNAIEPVLSATWDSLKAWWEGIDWKKLGEDVIDGIVTGIQASIGAVMEALRGLADEAKNAWDEFWDIASPSKLAEVEMVGPIKAGMVRGFENADPVRAAARDMAANTFTAARSSLASGEGNQSGPGGQVVNIYAQTREAAALAMAQVYMGKRARLDAYMGVG